jgi:hypothetical protein
MSQMGQHFAFCLPGRHGRSPSDSCRNYPRVATHPPCHVWTAPSWQEHSSRLQHWSVQPCVRPVCAVHMTAGHNALRGSGPGQKPAFDNALARVGCPDRRIDRLCITCCSPSQPSHHAGYPARSPLTPQARRVPCSAHPWPSWPRPSARSCWRARWRRLSSPAAPAMP